MTFRVEFSADAERDFEIIFEFLAESYIAFGEDIATALVHAENRVQGIREDAGSLARAPHRGTLHNEILPGLRHTTIGNAVFWFDVDEASQAVRILAVFFGSQDHQRRMLIRLFGSQWPG